MENSAQVDVNMDLIGVLADAIHDRCFGIASLKDPELALKEISDDGGIHEAVHQLLRALPPRVAISQKETGHGA